jgi:hypothetical protein
MNIFDKKTTRFKTKSFPKKRNKLFHLSLILFEKLTCETVFERLSHQSQ